MDAREKVAEAICGVTGSGQMFPWHTLNEREKDAWRAMADAALGALNLTEEWGATCDRWKGGRKVRKTRQGAEDDIVIATAPSVGPWSALEPPPPTVEEMRIESRLVTPWEARS